MKYILDHTNKPYAKLFEDISAIPRGSFKEDKIADFVCDFAKNLGLEYTRDNMNNIVVRKSATPGYEDHDTVMLQGHMDMIWNKRPGSTFDFETEGIKLKIEGEYLMAEETTCGSDDGVAIAYRTDLGGSNITFSKQAFEFIRRNAPCYVMIGDFTGFFDNLDHQYLKRQWCSLLDERFLPEDHYAVFRNVTHYSKWERSDLLKLNGLPDTKEGVKLLNKKSAVLTKEQFQQNRSHIITHPDPFGIP